MDNNNNKVIVATFQSHYGAMLLKKSLGSICSVRPVPRALSSSCGTCAFVEGSDADTVKEAADKSLLEAIYIKENEVYIKIYE